MHMSDTPSDNKVHVQIEPNAPGVILLWGGQNSPVTFLMDGSPRQWEVAVPDSLQRKLMVERLRFLADDLEAAQDVQINPRRICDE